MSENNKQNATIALVVSGISAVVFFAGLVIVVADFNQSANAVGITLTLLGGMLLLGSYLITKYYLRKMRLSERFERDDS
jgi:hypothetical protein